MQRTYSRDEVRKASLAFFSGDELATDVYVNKYALKDHAGNYYELSPAYSGMRLAKEFAKAEAKYANPMTVEQIYRLLMNVETQEPLEGLALVEAASGFGPIVPQGSPQSAMGNFLQIQSLSNCFVIDPPYDSYGGILHNDQEQSQIMKRRGGVGMDLSTIRPKGLPTSNAAMTTDGIGVFMQRFSNTCREVAQGGRRGALMLTISINHPEIETFINIKRDKTAVTGANISIRYTDEFMRAVEADSEYTLRWPCDVSPEEAKIVRVVKARDIWDQVIDAAWFSAEPGVLFWDAAQKYTPSERYASKGFAAKSTNPCVVGSTLIAVADGRNAVSIRQLVDEGKDVPVYSTNTMTGQVEIKWGRNPRLTKRNVEVWRLTLDDGTHFDATPDHKILTRDLRYVDLKDLQPGDSVFPFRTFDSNGYRQICDSGALMQGGARRNRRQYRLIHSFFNGDIDSKASTVHHIDFDSKNDSPDNLVAMLREDHVRLHAARMVGKNNPYHQMTSVWKHDFACHPGEKNGRYSGHTNSELLDVGRMLFAKHGKLTAKIYLEYAEQHGLPKFLSNEFRFGSWNNYVNQVATNHKVISVERLGVDDVYNITVDDNHNYHVVTSGDDNYVVSSGLCVKNCGEIVLSAYDSCRLQVVDLRWFVKNKWMPDAKFDFAYFDKIVQISQRLMDDLVDLEIEAVERIIAKVKADPEPDYIKAQELSLWTKIKNAAEQGRRTGLGITALGDTLAMLGLKYGSPESIAMTDQIYKALALASYRSSVKMAEERGAFPAYDYELEKDDEFINRIVNLDDDLRAAWKKFGRRNIANTTTAPVGSMSTQLASTSGIENVPGLKSKRRRKINPSDPDARVDYTDALGDKWQWYDVHHRGLQQWIDATGETDITKSPYWGTTINDVDWVSGVKLQAAAQKWVCHSISRTANLPKNATHELVSQVYLEAWRHGCKGFTVYRDGSRANVLLVGEEAKVWFDGIPDDELVAMLKIAERFKQHMPDKYMQTVDEAKAELQRRHQASESLHANMIDDIIPTWVQASSQGQLSAPRRPKRLPCHIHRVKVMVNGESETYLALVGLMEDKPYEIFCGLSKHVDLPRKFDKGTLVKNGRKKPGNIATYNLIIPTDDGEEIVFKDVVELFDNPNYGSFSRVLSLVLRHQIPLHFLVEQLQKDKYSDISSWARAIARVLKQYIPDGTKASLDKVCPQCNSDSLIYQSGCPSCSSCGWTKCA